MSESKTYVFQPESNSGLLSMVAPMLANKGVDTSALMALANRGGFGNGGWSDLIGLIVVCGLFGGNNGFFGNNNNSAEREMLLSAIQRNGLDISQIANAIGCSTSQIQAGINTLATQMQSVGSQVGMSGMQVINAIQAGNSTLAHQLAECCCENRLANCQQTNALQNAMAMNTQTLKDTTNAGFLSVLTKLDSIQNQNLLDKIDALREEKTALTNQLSQEHQNAYFAQVTAQTSAPINAAINSLSSEIECIKGKLPQTVTLPFSDATAVPNCVAYQYGLRGYPFGGNGFWG
jgi:hypothetical protein